MLLGSSYELSLLRRKTPELKALEERALLFGQDAGNGCQAPVLIRLVKLSRFDAQALQAGTKSCQLELITNCEVDVGRMEVRRTTILVRVLYCSMSCLHGLVREWEIAARDGVQVSVIGL